MKYPKKKGMLKYVLIIIGVVFVYLVVSKINEGFQTETIVYLYFDKDTTTQRKPKFISSTDQRVKYISSATDSVSIQIDPNFGTLKGFNGAVWSPANNNWLPTPTSALDKNLGTSLTLENNSKRVLNNSSSVTGNYMPSLGNKKLPTPVTAISGDIIIKGFTPPAFNFVTSNITGAQNNGDPANNNAKFRIDLKF